jgi:bloom syndrome protein
LPTQVTKPFGSASGLSRPFKPPSFVQKPQKVAPPKLEPEPGLEVNPLEEMDFNYDIPDIVEDDEDNPDEVFRECKLQFNFIIKLKVSAAII